MIKTLAQTVAHALLVGAAAIQTLVELAEEPDANEEGLPDGVYVNVQDWTVYRDDDGEPLALLRDPAHAVLIAREERRKMN